MTRISSFLYFLSNVVLSSGQLRGLQSLSPDDTVTISSSGGCSGEQEAYIDIFKSSTASLSLAPIILLLPGGAYNLIDDIVEDIVPQYINGGYNVAVLYYRLPRSATTQSWLVCSDPWEAIEDVSSAMEVLNDNSQQYNIDTSQIVLSGFSAGGHLAVLYSSICERKDLCPRAQVLHFPFLEKGSKLFCSDVGTAFLNTQDYDDCNPTSLVDAAAPPTVLYHAEGDTIVPTNQMTDLITALGEENTAYEYYEVPNGGHYLVPFSQVAAISGGNLTSTGTYASLVDRALNLPTPSCVRCDNIPTNWMTNNDKTCDNSSWHINNKCNDDTNWVVEGYCRASCFEAGRGYPNEICCPKKEVVVEECTECTDTPTPWMLNNGKTCNDSTSSLESNCNSTPWWTSNSYCQKSCYDTGRGYDGVVCCV